MADDSRFLVCCIGSSIGAIPLRYVTETLRPLPVTPLAGMPPGLSGLAVIRGLPTPVIELGRLLGLTATPATAPQSRFVSIALGKRTLAVVVDAVLGVRTLPEGVLADVPPLLSEAGGDCLSAIGALDAELLLVLESSRLLAESTWAALATARLTA